MSYTLGQSAKATGRSKATIHRAVQSGRISAAKDEATGQLRIDPAELHRVFPPVSEERRQNGSLKQHETPAETLLRTQLEQEREERQRERVQLEGTIDDLRRRLDAEAEERRRLTALLTDQRPNVPDVIPMPPSSTSTPPATLPAAAPTDSPATPPMAKMRPVRQAKAPAAEVGWFRRMLGGR
jgi:hypothetical protein